jgi:hypothetical protein
MHWSVTIIFPSLNAQLPPIVRRCYRHVGVLGCTCPDRYMYVYAVSYVCGSSSMGDEARLLHLF